MVGTAKYFIGILFFLVLAGSAYATTGTIDSTDKYAWGENIGWINFGSSQGNVVVSDTELTGFAWGENIGWISLNCSNTNTCAAVDYKVSNTIGGKLSGYAWSENTGWINFTPEFGVNPYISDIGEFRGLAWGENVGWINFNCAYAGTCATVDFKVKTDWLPHDSGGGGTGTQPQNSSQPTSVPSSSALPSASSLPSSSTQPESTPFEAPSVAPQSSPQTSPPSQPPSGVEPPGPPSGGSPSTGPSIFLLPKEFIGIVENIQQAIAERVPAVVQRASRPVSVVSGIGVAISGGASAVSLATSGINLFTYLEFFLKNLLIFFGLKKRARTWGTVYNARTKQPLPFTKIQLLGGDFRVLETRITDRDGRYGFLINAGGIGAQTAVALQLHPVREGFIFPSQKVTGTSDPVLYDRVYNGGIINVHTNDVIRFDIPMDPTAPDAAVSSLGMKMPRAKLHNFLATLSHIMFWIALVTLPLSYILNPTTVNLVMLVVFVVLNLIIVIGDLQQRPYGLVVDRQGGLPVPYSLITLHDTQGQRRGFTVSDEQGRYFLLSEKGNFKIVTHTPAQINPPRIHEESLSTDRGWIAKKLDL